MTISSSKTGFTNGVFKVLTTPVTTDIIAAINSVNSKSETDPVATAQIGALGSFGTISQSSVVSSINELRGQVSKATYSTSINSVAIQANSLVDSDNAIITKTGVSSGAFKALATPVTSDIIGTVNSVNSNVRILDNLLTTDKSNVVSVINEVKASHTYSLREALAADLANIFELVQV